MDQQFWNNIIWNANVNKQWYISTTMINGKGTIRREECHRFRDLLANENNLDIIRPGNAKEVSKYLGRTTGCVWCCY